MKRIWIAVVLISLAVSACVYEQIYVAKFCSSIESMVDKENIQGLKDYWDEENDIIYVFSTHEPIDELGRKIMALNDDNKKEALNEIRAINKAYYENQKINLSNIF